MRCGAAERVRRAVARGQGSGGGREKTVTVTCGYGSTAYGCKVRVSRMGWPELPRDVWPYGPTQFQLLA